MLKVAVLLTFVLLTCVKWNNSWSCVFKVSPGVRQGSVLSPYLFAVYVDDIGKLFNARLGTFVVLYANDILLLAPSVAPLKSLLQQCEKELNLIDMAINTKKFTAACVLVQEMTMCVLN